MAQAVKVPINGSTAYATSDDFCRIFSEEMDNLYVLGFLLTADAGKAEQCFVAGIGDSVEGNVVFREWARSWARRTIIQHAIRIVDPGRGKAAVARTEPVGMPIQPRLATILRLGDLERFVFVMSVLEGYSDHDCSLLLESSRQTVVNARARALEHLANAAEVFAIPEEGVQSIYTLVSN